MVAVCTVGNVPFGEYRVNDMTYNKLFFPVHNYFFAKVLDQVRPGGIVAFVTSHCTVDAKNPEVCRYLAGKALLLGAVRLPNNAFRANAGTEVVSDILFLQKREHPMEAEEEWVHLGQTEDGIVLNSYFLSHPEMVLGRLALESSQYGKEECTVLPIPGAELSEQLKRAAALVRGNYRESLETEPEAAESMGKCIPADPGVKNFSYCVVDGGVYFRENSLMRLAERYGTGAERVRGMVGLRQIVNELIEYQMEDYPEEAIRQKQGELKRRQGEGFSIRQMEKTRKGLQARLDKLTSTERKDDVVCFEQLGVDRLFVDESQAYKNLFLYTKMCNVAGLSTSEAQRGSDMFMKCRYLDEVTGGRGVVFASGTPVSNSMTEMYTVMRYLQYDTLQQKGLSHFDCWASTFGETTTSIELAPEGNGYRARIRFAKFFNLPELMNLFKEAADIKTADQLNLPVPEAVFETVVVQPSQIQKEMVADLSERAARVHAGQVNASEDNMLCITADGRKIGLDQRLMNPLLPDDPGSKLNACVSNVLRIWEEGRGQRLTQMIFCDLSTPKRDGSFNVYDDIRGKLLSGGIPAAEVAFIHHADTETKKKELFTKVRCGKVRVLLGSTQKIGAGTNVQDLLAAVHHLDVGWRPADMTQRNGRIIRQGNRNSQVRIYQYVTEGTFDAYLYQTLESKQKFISQIMTSKSPVRSCEDVDEQVLSYAEIKALCAGNPLIRQKMDLDIDVARLKVLKADHMNQQYRLEEKLLKYFPAELERQSGYVRGLGEDGGRADAHPVPVEGFAGMELSYSVFQNEYEMTLKGDMSHSVKLGGDARGNQMRMDHVLAGIPEREKEAGEQLEILKGQREAAMAELGKPFPQEAELAEKSRRLVELDAELNMDMAADAELDKDADVKDVDANMDVGMGADMDQDAGMGVDGECAERAGRGAAGEEREKAAGRAVGEPVGEPARKMAGEMVGGISEKIAEQEAGKAVSCPQADNPAKVNSRERNSEVRKSVLEDLKSRSAVPGAAPKRRASHEEVL